MRKIKEKIKNLLSPIALPLEIFDSRIMTISKWVFRNVVIFPAGLLFFNSFSPIKFHIFNGITQISELKNEFYVLILFILALAVAYFLNEGFKWFAKKY